VSISRSRYRQTNGANVTVFFEGAPALGALVREFALRYQNPGTRRQYEAELSAVSATSCGDVRCFRNDSARTRPRASVMAWGTENDLRRKVEAICEECVGPTGPIVASRLSWRRPGSGHGAFAAHVRYDVLYLVPCQLTFASKGCCRPCVKGHVRSLETSKAKHLPEFGELFFG
jgi:hypothetical protein